MLVYIYYDGLDRMVLNWFEREEYSHGSMIPLLSLFLIWRRKNELATLQVTHPWSGLYLTAFGLVFYFLGEISAITIITQYSFIVTIAGITLAYAGWDAFKRIWIAFLFLIFMIPLPAVIFQQLSQHLQLISSEIGVGIIRLFGISVFLEGNVIDLGAYKLQVVEACSGLRYLFPLMSLAFIGVYFYKAEFWKRVLVFASSIPITILLNSIRIGIIGVLVEYWGVSMAEGFVHDFEGWIVFMFCTAILVLEMWLLTFIGTRREDFRHVFGFDMPEKMEITGGLRKLPRAFMAAVVLVAISTAGAHFAAGREEVKLDRSSLSTFPLQLDQWNGVAIPLQQNILDRLDLTDYVLATYVRPGIAPVNLYAAYYESQRKGASIHSPRACLPGGGWRIDSLKDYTIPSPDGGEPLIVNRVLMKKGDSVDLVYYWFKQRDRMLTNEYAIKWYLFVDALLRNRTDGALVRLTTTISVDETPEDGDKRLMMLLGQVKPLLSKYVPD
jgi:exosortase D (VPLPA-CTERM-specific)